MINFANPQYVYLLLLIPLLFVAYAVRMRLRRRKITKIGDPALVGALMPSVSRAKGWIRVSLFSVALLFFTIGLMRPQIGARLKEKRTSGAEIMIALDVSNSMLAEDYSPNRLERAKLAISNLVDKLHDDRIGLVIFAGTSFVQLPITNDYISAKMFLNAISNESMPVQGTALGDALSTSIRGFSEQSKNSRAVILITDGENHEDDAVSVAKEAAKMGIRVFCIGVGSPQGKPIPYGDDYLKDKQGNIVVTKLDEVTLRDIASAGNGIYVRAGSSEFGLNPVIDEIRNMDAEMYKSVVFEDFDEQYMYFFAIALLFLVLEMLIGERKVGKKLFCVVSLLMLSSVMLSAQPDAREVRRGNRDFKKENYSEAEIEYRKGLLKDSLSVASNYNLANLMYMQERFEEAGKNFRALEDSVELGEHISSYNYNYGNLQLRLKQYEKAIEKYKNALRANPSDMDAKENLAYAQKMLKNQQNQDKNQDKDKNQNQDQDQNQNQDKDKNKNQNQDQNQNQNQNQNEDQTHNNAQQQKIPAQAAEQMLQAIQAKEKETKEKVDREKAEAIKTKQREKNW